jgi:hypothetical protein
MKAQQQRNKNGKINISHIPFLLLSSHDCSHLCSFTSFIHSFSPLSTSLSFISQIVGPALFNLHPVSLWFGAFIGSINAVHTHSAYRFWGMSLPEGKKLS